MLNSRCLQDGISRRKNWEGIQFVSRIFRFWAGFSVTQQDLPLLSEIFHFLLYSASIFTLASVNQHHPGWMVHWWDFFFCPCANQGSWPLFSYPFAALISVFVLELFLLPTHHSGFFFCPFETFPPPTYSPLPIPLTPTYLLTFIFKMWYFHPPTYPHPSICPPTHLYTYLLVLSPFYILAF